VEGIVFWIVARGHRPRATVQNTIPDTEGQPIDCSQITYEITVLLPDQLLQGGILYKSEHARETVETIDRSTVRSTDRSLQGRILCDVRVCEGNSQNYWPVNSSRTWMFLEFQETVKNTKLHSYKVSGKKTIVILVEKYF
jgi:hypothetical protein